MKFLNTKMSVADGCWKSIQGKFVDSWRNGDYKNFLQIAGLIWSAYVITGC